MPARKRVTKVPDPPVDHKREEPSAFSEASDEIAFRDTRPPEDGGVEQHPIHDDDQEDLQPEDFENEIDAAAKGGFDTTDKYEIERKAGRKLKEPGAV